MINYLKKISPFEAILIAAMLGMHIYAAMADPRAFPNNWFVRDDAYYYFKVAQNIAEGHGSTFDGINLTNGYHPLWMLICIPIFALAKYDLILPLRVLLVVIAIIHTATSVMIYRLIKAHLSHAVAIAAAVFWSFNNYIHATVYEMGLETPIAVFSVVLVIYALSKFEAERRTNDIPAKRIAWLGFIAALAMFSRLDLVFFAVIIGIWVVFRDTPMRILAPLDIAIIFFSMTFSVILRTGFASYNTIYASSAIEATLIALVTKLIALYFFGAYQHPRLIPVIKMFQRLFFATVTGAVATVGIYMFATEMGFGRDFPRSAFLIDIVISLVLFSASRFAAAWFATPNRIQAEAPLVQFKSHWKKWLHDGLIFYGILGGLLLAYMIFNHFMFGTSSPVSGQIKRWWGSMPNTVYERPASNWASYFGLGEDTFETGRPFTDAVWEGSPYIRPLIPGADKQDERFFALLFVVFLISLVVIFINKRRSAQAFINLGFIPLAAGTIVHILSYSATAYGGAKEWYWVCQMVVLTLATSLLLDLILKPFRRFQFVNLLLVTVAVIYGMNSADRFLNTVEYAMPQGRFDPNLPLMDAVAYIEANSLPGEIIGSTGSGNIGYFIQDRTIVNMDGLINSKEYFQALQDREAARFLSERGMTVVFASPSMLSLPPYYDQFDPYLDQYSSYGGKSLFYLLEEPE
jgi:hypothetical protein